MKRYYILAILSIVAGFGVFFACPALAQEQVLKIHFDQVAIARGYTAEFDPQSHPQWGDFRLAIIPNLVNEPINLEMKKIDGDEYTVSAGLERVSEYYLYDILREDQSSKAPLALSQPLVLAVKFHSDNFFRKKIYFWNKPAQTWTALPSTADFSNGYIRAYSHLPYSIIAVFEDKSELEGKASWYRSSKCRFGAATNNYALGAKLRVKNISNNKIVDVEVVSSGPFGQGRVIDLTLPAFQAIEDKHKGLAQVQVWPLNEEVKVLGVEINKPPINKPVIESKSAIAINEATGDVLFAKNEQAVLPLASLTKIMTAVVFLETNTPFDKIVVYEAGDSAIGSKLYVSPGETMKVKDLFYASLAGSANNATNALARSTGLSREQFVSRMNAKAKEWGLIKTKFVDVTGLDPANATTASEYAKLFQQALKDFRILQGTTTPVYAFKTINTDKAHVIKNKDKMIGSQWYITGLKTGYLDEALYCLAVKVRQDKNSSLHVITVILGSATDLERYAETKALINYALSQL